MNNKKHIFCFVIFILFCTNNITFCSFLPLVNTAWKEEVKQSSPKIYINKNGLMEIPKDIECHILRFCDFDMLKKITETSKSGKELIGYACKNQGTAVYEMIKKYPHDYRIDSLDMHYGKHHMHMDWYKPLNLFKTLLVVIHQKSSAFKNNPNTLLRYLEIGGSPLRAFAYTIIDKVIIDPAHHAVKDDLLFSYIKNTNCIEFRSNDLKSEEKYIHAIQKNKDLEKITFKGPFDTDAVTFPNLSQCVNLNYLCIDSCSSNLDWNPITKIPNLTILEIHVTLQKLPLLLKVLPHIANLKIILMHYNFHTPGLNRILEKAEEKNIYTMLDLLTSVKTLEKLKITGQSYQYKRSFEDLCLKYYKYKRGVFFHFLESYTKKVLIEHYTKKLECFYPGLTLKAVKINFFEDYGQILCSTSEKEETIQIIVFKENFKINTCRTENLFELINNQHYQTILCIKNNKYKKIDNTNCILEMLSSFDVLEKIEYCIIKNYLNKTSVLNKELIKQKFNNIKKIQEKDIQHSCNFSKDVVSITKTNQLDKKLDENLPKNLAAIKDNPIGQIDLSHTLINDLEGNKKKIFKNYGFIDIFLSQMKYLFFVALFLYLKDTQLISTFLQFLNKNKSTGDINTNHE